MSVTQPDFDSGKRLLLRVAPWLVGVLGIGVTVMTWNMVRADLEAAAEVRLVRLRERVEILLEERFRSLEQTLYAIRPLMEPTGHVSQAQWREYAGNMQRFLDRQVVGLGFVERVARDRLPELEARIRADGLPGFAAERGGTAAQAYIVTHLEPRETNAAALGLDIGSGNTRRMAAEEAMRTGRPVIGRRIQIVEGEKQVPGSLLFLPVYAGGADPGAPDARVAALRGWVYASIRIDLLAASAVESLAGLMDLELYEGRAATAETLLFDSTGGASLTDANWPVADAGRLTIGDRLDLYGQTWTYRIATLPGFDSMGSVQLPRVVLFGGLGASLLGAALTWALAYSRRQAYGLAERMTKDLRVAEAQGARLAVVARHATTSVMLMDANRRIEWVNESFIRLFGYSAAEVAGRHPVDLLHGAATSPETADRLRRELEAGSSFRGEILNYTKAGEAIWLEIDVQPLRDAAGAVTGYMVLQVDITERKRQADELKQAMEAARRADQAKSQFLAMMSHEIRTPMNGVIGMTSLLKDSPLSRDQRDYVETIRQSGDALLTIINEILDFSKIESGHLELEQETFDLRECLESALDVLAPKAAEKQLDLLYEIDESVPQTIRSDAARLRQILVNLLGNAVKFTLRGEVVLSVRSAVRPDGRTELRFAVRDTGIGIAPEAVPRLFQSFTQVEASTARRFGGTGLGLAISKRLAELLGGAMWVESVLGQGSTFHFTVLSDAVTDQPRPGSDPDLALLRGLRVLIVDDNATSRRILGSLVTGWGMTFQGAGAAAEALALLEGGRSFDVAVIDLQMPVMDGAALARAIRALPLRQPLPLVLLCHAGQREQLAEPEMFAACLAKPAKPAQFLEALTGLFRALRPAAASVPAPPAPPAPLRRQTERVLVAEDNKVNLKVLLLMLRKLGYEAELAGDGIEVIEALRRQHFDVILMDVQMPGMDGLEACRRIRAGATGRPDRVWIIAVTANAMEGDRERCLAAGMDDYISKPIDIIELEWALVRAHHALTAR